MDENEILARAKELLQASAAGMNSLAVADCSDEVWAALLGTNEQVLQKSTQVMAHASLAMAQCGDCGSPVVKPPPPPPDPDPKIKPECRHFLHGERKTVEVENFLQEYSFNISSFSSEEDLSGGWWRYKWPLVSVRWSNPVAKMVCSPQITELASRRRVEGGPILFSSGWDKLLASVEELHPDGLGANIRVSWVWRGGKMTNYHPKSTDWAALHQIKIGKIHGIITPEQYAAKVRELNP